MKTMTKSEFRTALESLLGLESGSIQDDEPLLGLPGWDSMAVLLFIGLADERLGETPSPGAVVGCGTVADLANLFPGQIV